MVSESAQCPNCKGVLFEKHIPRHLVVKQNSATPDEIIDTKSEAPFWTCIQCGFALYTASDLHPSIVMVYLVGNSHSKRRQGAGAVAAKIPALKSPPGKFIKMLHQLNEEGICNLHEDTSLHAWVFTQREWERYTKDKPFPLMASGTYTTEVIDLR